MPKLRRLQGKANTQQVTLICNLGIYEYYMSIGDFVLFGAEYLCHFSVRVVILMGRCMITLTLITTLLKSHIQTLPYRFQYTLDYVMYYTFYIAMLQGNQVG